jgi:hypothetical protein
MDDDDVMNDGTTEKEFLFFCTSIRILLQFYYNTLYYIIIIYFDKQRKEKKDIMYSFESELSYRSSLSSLSGDNIVLTPRTLTAHLDKACVSPTGSDSSSRIPSSHISPESSVVANNHTVFIGDLSYFCTEEHLIPVFRPYGIISEVKVKRNNKGETLMFGFVSYEDESSVNAAIAELNGKEFMGRCLR